jgi:hypothetical protein
MVPKDVQRVIIGLMVLMALIVETAIPEVLEDAYFSDRLKR